MKTVLITGAGGFVGKNLAEFFSEKYNVFALRHSDLDLLDEEAVRDFFKRNKIDIILHCANIGGSRKSNYDVNSIDIVEKNLRMFFNIEYCLTSEMRMIHFGSGAEYDRQNYKPKMDETYFDSFVPSDAYGYSKYVMSKFIEKRQQIVCLRIFGLFGKYEDYRFRFISNAIVKNLLHLPIVINQNVVFDYLYISDFCKIVEHFIECEPQYSHYNLTPSESIDLVTIANLINEISDYKSSIHVLNNGMNREYSGNNERILKELGQFTFMSYQDAIKNLFEYYKLMLHSLDIKAIKEDSYLKACMVLRK